MGVQGRATQIQSSVAKPPQSPTQIYPRLSSLDSGQKQMPLGSDSKPPIGRNHLADKVSLIILILKYSVLKGKYIYTYLFVAKG